MLIPATSNICRVFSSAFLFGDTGLLSLVALDIGGSWAIKGYQEKKGNRSGTVDLQYWQCGQQDTPWDLPSYRTVKTLPDSWEVEEAPNASSYWLRHAQTPRSWSQGLTPKPRQQAAVREGWSHWVWMGWGKSTFRTFHWAKTYKRVWSHLKFMCCPAYGCQTQSSSGESTPVLYRSCALSSWLKLSMWEASACASRVHRSGSSLLKPCVDWSSVIGMGPAPQGGCWRKNGELLLFLIRLSWLWKEIVTYRNHLKSK